MGWDNQVAFEDLKGHIFTSIDIRWLGESNGYYSESVSLESVGDEE